MGATDLVNIEQIRQLVEMMVAHDLIEISLRNGSEEVSLRRPNSLTAPVPTQIASQGAAPAGPIGAAAGSAAGMGPDDANPPRERLIEITSPMVGTFYAAPDPDSPPFLEVGTSIQVGSVVCILEAMKVFNEIKSEVAGVVERILVKNAQTVEYGQPLFLVRPA
jgi:acetyl-CoA carboxylase biotin carboxyl carrier protein